MKSAILFLVVVVLSVAGCTKRQGSDLRHGTLSVLATESHLPLVQQLAVDYRSMYPDVVISLDGTTTRGAIVEMVNDSIHCVIVDRRLNDEEREAAQNAKLNVVESEIARDALVLLVHPKNKLAMVTMTEFGSILSGEMSLWSKLPGSKLNGAIELCLTGRNSGLYELVKRSFFKLQKDVPLAAVSFTRECDCLRCHPPRSARGCLVCRLEGYDAIRISTLEKECSCSGSVGEGCRGSARGNTSDSKKYLRPGLPVDIFSLYLHIGENAGHGTGIQRVC